jgi:hypothetical protein
MRKISALIASYLLKGYMRILKPEFRLVQMRSYHVDDAARLLSTQFCEHEPLCHALGIKYDEIYYFFRQQVLFSASKGLGVVVEHINGKVVAAMTIEDHMDQMPVDPEKLAPNIALIGQILDRVKLPAVLEPETCGEVYYCGIGAVDIAFRSQNLLRIMIIGSYVKMVEKGYKVGYAKISSPAVLKTIARIEKDLPFRFFHLEEAKKASEFPELAPYDLKNFKLSLMQWHVGRYQGQPADIIA